MQRVSLDIYCLVGLCNILKVALSTWGCEHKTNLNVLKQLHIFLEVHAPALKCCRQALYSNSLQKPLEIEFEDCTTHILRPLQLKFIKAVR